MKEGRYISKTTGRHAWLYKTEIPVMECDCCGKMCNHSMTLQWEDDEQNIAYIYGSHCIKKLKLVKA